MYFVVHILIHACLSAVNLDNTDKEKNANLYNEMLQKISQYFIQEPFN